MSFIEDVRLHLSVNMWTSDAPAGVAQEEGHTGVACLNFSSREGFGHPFLSSTVTSNFNFVYPRHNSSPLVGHDVRENPSACDCAKIRTHVPLSKGSEVTN